MNKEFIQVTKGVVPLSVLALLAIALIAGQAGTDLSITDPLTTVALAADNPGKKDVWQLGQPDRQQDGRRSVQSLQVTLDSLATIPYELDLYTLIPRGAINAEILTNRKLGRSGNR